PALDARAAASGEGYARTHLPPLPAPGCESVRGVCDRGVPGEPPGRSCGEPHPRSPRFPGRGGGEYDEVPVSRVIPLPTALKRRDQRVEALCAAVARDDGPRPLIDARAY